ncbi:hypothetical protein BDR26DRAFT_874770 [Obelidium mucronatum]|nr:hypothetical protein BDR26DRAFT_874770 [Obelidium mucronatum]
MPSSPVKNQRPTRPVHCFTILPSAFGMHGNEPQSRFADEEELELATEYEYSSDEEPNNQLPSRYTKTRNPGNKSAYNSAAEEALAPRVKPCDTCLHCGKSFNSQNESNFHTSGPTAVESQRRLLCNICQLQESEMQETIERISDALPLLKTKRPIGTFTIVDPLVITADLSSSFGPQRVSISIQNTEMNGTVAARSRRSGYFTFVDGPPIAEYDCLARSSAAAESDNQLLTARPPAPIFKCKTCNDEFSNQKELDKHRDQRRTFHSCRICKISFPFACALLMHRKKEHNEQFQRKIKKAEKAEKAEKVTKTEKNDKPFGSRRRKRLSCSFCGKVYFHESSLKCHVTKTHSKISVHAAE